MVEEAKGKQIKEKKAKGRKLLKREEWKGNKNK